MLRGVFGAPRVLLRGVATFFGRFLFTFLLVVVPPPPESHFFHAFFPSLHLGEHYWCARKHLFSQNQEENIEIFGLTETKYERK